MNKKQLIVIVVIAVVVLGGFFAFISANTDNGKVKLPVLGGPTHTVSNFSFTDQHGRTITNDSLDGKIYVANFFFTTCEGVCPAMNRNVKEVYDALHQYPNFMILSHTVDPSTDSVPVLEKYSEQWNANPYQWLFLTGPKKELYNMARRSYLLSVSSGNGGQSDFVHTQMLALVDGRGRIRGFYDGLKQKEINQLIKDAKQLLKDQS